jgi:hypothetical protein
LTGCEDNGSSSFEDEGVKGNPVFCESGLEGADEDDEDEDEDEVTTGGSGGGVLHCGDCECGDRGNGILGGNGKLKSTFVNVTTISSEISSNVGEAIRFIFIFVGDITFKLRARLCRLRALVVGVVGVLRGEVGDSRGMLVAGGARGRSKQ